MEGFKQNRAGTSKDKFKKHFHVKRQYSSSCMTDRLIIPRVKQYMEDHNHSGAGIIDVDEMVDDLRARYPEYGRRKRAPFKQGVCNAFDIVYKSFGMSSDVSDWGVTSDMSDLSSASDKDADLDEADCNSTNNQMLSVYMRQPPPQNKRKRTKSDEDEKELINISSDEEVPKNDDSKMPVQKSQNGANVAQKTQASPPVKENANKAKQTAVIVKKEIITQNKVIPPTYPSTPPASNLPKLNVNTSAKKKKKWKEVETRQPSVSFKDFGGSPKVLEEVCKLLIHVRHPEVYKQIGVTPPRGFLLHGPPGCGKTLLAHAIAGELGVPLLNVAGPELVAGVSGESEERIRDLFEQAADVAPCILFLDEVDALAPNRHTAQREMERRIVAQLLSCLDDLTLKPNGENVVVIGATNRPDTLDPALRRAGRFDREVCLGIPDKNARAHILSILCNKLKIAPDFSYEYIAANTPGFVGADLLALTREASMVAVNRVFLNLKTANKPENKETTEEESSKENSETKNEESSHKGLACLAETAISTATVTDNNKAVSDIMEWLQKDRNPLSEQQLNELMVELNDFKQALKHVQPSAKREGFATVPDVTWDDVGSLGDIREELQMTILAPVRHPEQFAELGISAPSGVLLCGPPGCGKTLLAKAVANEAGINFISVKGPELLNMYVGESERAVRQCFQRAKNSAPCVIFFDELDALCPKRSDSGEGGASMRVVNQMLTEMDGIESRRGVFLMAASNRPEIIDPAVLRPGRLDKTLYVGLPSPDDRVEILKALTKNGTKPKLDEDVDLITVGKNAKCSCFTGADLAALVREAGIEALREYMTDSTTKKLIVSNKHFEKALDKICPSVSDKDLKHYEKLQKLYSSTKS